MPLYSMRVSSKRKEQAISIRLFVLSKKCCQRTRSQRQKGCICLRYYGALLPLTLVQPRLIQLQMHGKIDHGRDDRGRRIAGPGCGRSL